MILYHASTVKIEKFHVPLGGIHMGGINSAIEAALRKVRGHYSSDVPDVYLHRLEVDLGRSVVLDDAADCQNWRDMINLCIREGYDSIEYSNLYEPDLCHSFMVWEPSRVKIIDVEVMNQDKAEDIVDEFYKTYNFQ